MKRRIVESMSMEEAFRALNTKPSKKKLSESLNESVDSEIIELPGDIWGYPEFFAFEVSEYGPDIAALDDSDSTVSVIEYYYNQNLSESDLIAKKIFVLNPKFYDDIQDAEEAETLLAGIKDGTEDVSGFGFQLANGDYLYTEENHNVSSVYVKCRDYNSMIKYIRGDIILDHAPFGDAKDIIESLNESADDDFEDDYDDDFEDNTDKELTDEIIKKELLETQADYKPERSDLSFQAWVEDNAGYLYGSYIIGQEFSGAFLSAEEEAELTAVEDRVRAIANQILSKENESLNESASSGYIMVTQGFGDASYECHLEHFSERSLLVEAVLDECQVEDSGVYEKLIKLPPDAFNKQLSAIVEDASENGIFDDFGVAYIKDLSTDKIIAGVDLRDEIIDMITQYASDDIAAQTAIEDLNNDRTFDFEA